MKFVQVPDGDLVSINQIICFNRERLCVWGRTVPINDQVYESLRQHIAVLNPDAPTCAVCGSPELESGTAGCKDCNDYTRESVFGSAMDGLIL